LAWDTTDVPRF
jgi:predicted secreted protein